MTFKGHTRSFANWHSVYDFLSFGCRTIQHVLQHLLLLVYELRPCITARDLQTLHHFGYKR